MSTYNSYCPGVRRDIVLAVDNIYTRCYSSVTLVSTKESRFSMKVLFFIVSLLAVFHVGRWYEYERAYLEGQLYAYDNAVVCNADIEAEGLRVAGELGRVSNVSSINCEEK